MCSACVATQWYWYELVQLAKKVGLVAILSLMPDGGGLCKLNPVYPELESAWFHINPWTYTVISWFFKMCFQMQLAPATRRQHLAGVAQDVLLHRTRHGGGSLDFGGL
jgi:hypothetical protein